MEARGGAVIIVGNGPFRSSEKDETGGFGTLLSRRARSKNSFDHTCCFTFMGTWKSMPMFEDMFTMAGGVYSTPSWEDGTE